MKERVSVGDRVTFSGEVKSYKVRAVSPDERYAICTKPFNLKKTVIYSIIDFEENRRASDDRIFCSGYETDDDVAERMNELVSGKLALSRRHSCPLHIVKIKHPCLACSALVDMRVEPGMPKHAPLCDLKCTKRWCQQTGAQFLTMEEYAAQKRQTRRDKPPYMN